MRGDRGERELERRAASGEREAQRELLERLRRRQDERLLAAAELRQAIRARWLQVGEPHPQLWDEPPNLRWGPLLRLVAEGLAGVQSETLRYAYRTVHFEQGVTLGGIAYVLDEEVFRLGLLAEWTHSPRTSPSLWPDLASLGRVDAAGKEQRLRALDPRDPGEGLVEGTFAAARDLLTFEGWLGAAGFTLWHELSGDQLHPRPEDARRATPTQLARLRTLARGAGYGDQLGALAWELGGQRALERLTPAEVRRGIDGVTVLGGGGPSDEELAHLEQVRQRAGVEGAAWADLLRGTGGAERAARLTPDGLSRVLTKLAKRAGEAPRATSKQVGYLHVLIRKADTEWVKEARAALCPDQSLKEIDRYQASALITLFKHRATTRAKFRAELEERSRWLGVDWSRAKVAPPPGWAPYERPGKRKAKRRVSKKTTRRR